MDRLELEDQAWKAFTALLSADLQTVIYSYLINPTVVDARTEITTELLSEEGFVVTFTDDAGEDQQEAFITA